MQIPLFPLSSVVLPGGILPLRIFEPRYLDMVRDCFKQQSGFGVCLIKAGAEVGDTAVPLAYGTLVDIVDWDQDDSGLLTISALGKQKFRIIDTEKTKSGLLIGTVELLPFELNAPVPAELHHLQDTMQQILDQVSPSIEYTEPALDDALWLGSRFVELLPMSAEMRHELLSMDNPIDRLTAVNELLMLMATKARSEKEE
jgi:Lon protease-like protein